MEIINKRLQELYAANFIGVNEIFNSKKNIDGPYLMYCQDEEYNVSQRKVMFIGQEGTGGIFRDYLGHPTDQKINGERLHYLEMPNSFLENCVENYKQIVKKQIVKPGGEFWKQLNKINKALNKESLSYSFLSTNVSKYCNCEANGKPPLSWIDHKYVVEKFNVLSKEIEICKPDVIIFFSGPNYDDKIKCQFDGELTFTPLVENISSRVLAKVSHSLLPINTYRTYHPSYLKRKKLNYIDVILNDITLSQHI